MEIDHGVERLRRELERPAWAAPFAFWGPPGATPTPFRRSAGGEALRLFDHARDCVGAGASLIVIAAGSGAGKSAMLAELLEAIPDGRATIHVRGGAEHFDFVESVEPRCGTLIVNEMSPHLPTYCWGERLRRVFALRDAGYQLLGTAHAASPEAWRTLMIDEVGVPAEHLAGVRVVMLDPVPDCNPHCLTRFVTLTGSRGDATASA